MAKYMKIPTVQEINKLYERAERGDSSALSDLINTNRQLSRRANNRMSDLRKAGFGDTAAIRRAEYYLQEAGVKGKGFRTGRKLSLDDVTENLEQVVQFLNYQTSTVSGERKRRREIINQMRENGINIRKGDENKFLEFLDSDAWSEFKYISSGRILEEAAEKINAGASIKELNEAYEKYQSGEVDIFEAWDEWQGRPEDEKNKNNSGTKRKRNRRK